MRVAIVCDSAGAVRGGVEYHASRLSKAVEDLGASPQLVNRRQLPNLNLEEFDGLFIEGVVRGTLLRLRLSPGWASVRKVLFTHGSFIAETHLSRLLARGTARWLGPCLSRLVMDYSVVRPILRDLDAIVVLSPSEVADVRRIAGERPSRVLSQPLLGVNPGRMVKPNALKMPRSVRAPYVCAVARVDQRKNFLSVVRAVRGTDYSFVLAGQDSGGLRAILEYVRRNHVHNFAYLGVVDDETRLELIRGSVATILPSFFEGLPYFALDSLALGVPCILTSLSYTPALAGLVFCRPSEIDIREAVLRLGQGRPVVQPMPPIDDLEITRSLLRIVFEGSL